MRIRTLEDIDILDVGNTIQISGALWSGNGKHYLCFLPDEYDGDSENLELIIMNLEDWKKFIRQTDLCETEIFQKDQTGGLKKVIVRKTTRQIDSRIQWRVFQRDNYTCRYCGRTGIPLTVDHLVLWEKGGPTIEENLIAACKKCNKTRGNTEYGDWIRSEKYKRISNKLDEGTRLKNEAIEDTLADLPRVHNKKSR